ncbi:MAG: L-histidine Nalpha-methyltransferase [Chthoniobacter sp.]|jgi:hypothetical protein|nr:L-histidine Nalpha-methyltransferase [Chthoniobacter sp.]
MKTVFIGSSREALDEIAEPIAKALAENGFNVIRWWTPEAFPPGNYIFEQLRKHAMRVDAAVFVAGADDETWCRGEQVSKARDNVILEVGLFAGHVGLNRCLVVSGAQVRLPVDLGGVVYVDLGSTTVAEAGKRVVNSLTESFKETTVRQSDAFRIVCDSKVANGQMVPDERRGWLLRNNYFGLEGAEAWLALSSDPIYSELALIRPKVSELLRREKADFRSYLSLGPGDGALDRFVVSTLRKPNPDLKYVPVDISEGLLFTTFGRLNGAVNIPVGILGDFEEGLHFVMREAQRHCGPPMLVGLLGNTFGNLDRDEGLFLEELFGHLREGDAVLLEVTLFKPGDETFKSQPAKWTKAKRRFYAVGAARRLGVPIEKLLKAFTKSFTATPAQPGQIPGSRRIRFVAKSGDQTQTVAFIRRYSEEGLRAWLESQNLDVTAERIEFPGAIDSGLFLLRKKS